MRVKSSIGLAVGPVNAAHWGQVLVQPDVYGILEIENPDGAAQQRGVETLSALGEQLATPPTSLQAIEEIADRVMRPNIRTLVLFIPVGAVVYIVLRGNGSVYIKRKNELASLIHQDGAISGEIQEGDTFLLASHGFSHVLSHEELTQTFDHLPPVDIAEKLTLLLHEKTDGEGSVALVYQAVVFEEGQKEEEPPQVLEEMPIVKEEKMEGDLMSTLRKIRSGLRIRHRIRYLHEHPKSLRFLIVIVFIVLFLGSVVIGVVKQRSAAQSQKIAAVMNDAQHALDEGTALLDLNQAKGRERLTQAKQMLDPLMQTIPPRTDDGRRLTQLYRQITDNLTQAMHVVHAPLRLFYDVSLLKKGSSVSDMALEGDTMAITDGKSNTVYALDVSTKNAQVIAGGDGFKGMSLAGIHGDNAYVLSQDGINAVRISDKKSTVTIIKKDDSWGVIRSLVAFGGNIYLLDTFKNRVWKYVATDKGAGFSDIREYLTPDTLPDFSRANNMVIDGYVWVATTDGKIMRFAQGQQSTFTIQGVDPALGNTLMIYTSDEAKNIYVLDGQNKRVVVLDKEGMYVAQYSWEDSVTVMKFAVSETQHKIFLLAAGKIYAQDLK